MEASSSSSRQSDGVVVLVPLAHHLLALDGLADRSQLVPQPGRPLELQVRGRRPHLALEPFDDRLGVAVEEVGQLADERGVVGRADVVDARRRALLDVGVQAGPAEPPVPLELVVVAGADRERPQQEVERLPDGVGMGERPVVADAVALGAPHHHGPGPLLADGDGQVGVGLVVLQPDVEAGLVLLDEVELEEQRLDLVADQGPLHALGGGDHLPGPGQEQRRVDEIVVEAAAEALGLADVDDAAVPVLELVGPGSVRNRAGGGAGEHRPPILPVGAGRLVRLRRKHGEDLRGHR